MAEVLLVDDNGSVLLTLAIALRRRGHCVTVAADGASALSELQARRFDFLISDVRMPGMTGIELATAARALPHPPRIILTSAYSTIEGRDGLAEAFLRKPIDTEQLDSLLHEEIPTPKADSPVQKADSKAAIRPSSVRAEATAQARRGLEPAFG